MEKDTAIRHKLNIVGDGFEQRWLYLAQDGGNVGCEIGYERYDNMVEALVGCDEFVEKPEDIRPAIERAMKAGKPALVNVCTDPEAQATTDMGFSAY
jgi:thiamine pyrophosphate-dependent acetolactate synthase large subunit-like protein